MRIKSASKLGTKIRNVNNSDQTIKSLKSHNYKEFPVLYFSFILYNILILKIL
jgi:hypothetical protein